MSSLLVEDVVMNFGGVHAVDGVTLEIAAGERRANHLAHELCPGRHIEEHFGVRVDADAVTLQQQIANRFA